MTGAAAGLGRLDYAAEPRLARLVHGWLLEHQLELIDEAHA